jgi:uncharacterized protein (DUF779 family)
MTIATSSQARRHPLHQRVCATPTAIDAIVRLRASRGSVTLHHLDGDECEVEARHVERPLQARRTNICAGIVGGAPFLVDRKHDAELGFPRYEIDFAARTAAEERTGAASRLISRVVPAGENSA